MTLLGYVTWLSDWTLQKMVGMPTVHSFFFIYNMEEFWECWYRILHTPNVRVVFVDGCNESINPHPTRTTSDPSPVILTHVSLTTVLLHAVCSRMSLPHSACSPLQKIPPWTCSTEKGASEVLNGIRPKLFKKGLTQ